MGHAIFGLIIVLILCISGTVVTSKPGNRTLSAEQETEILNKFKTKWRILKQESHDPERQELVRSVYRQAAGVYRDKSHAKRLNLSKTVLVSVISSDSILHRGMWYNWLCFVSHYKYDTILYVVKSDHDNQYIKGLMGNYEEVIEALDSHPLINNTLNGNNNSSNNNSIGNASNGDVNNKTAAAARDSRWKAYQSFQSSFLTDPNIKAIISLSEGRVRVLPFPNELFWELLLEKSSYQIPAKGVEDYMSDFPSFLHFGALVMLIPTYEALTLGYNAIFFDIDIGLVDDPIPYIVRGKADFSVSQEIRTCQQLISRRSKTSTKYWWGSEPNTGIMHVRATPAGIGLYREWLRRLIDKNIANDQYLLRFSDYPDFYPYFTDSCNGVDTVPYENPQVPPGVSADKVLSFCFLSEYLYQNGLTSLHCYNGAKRYMGSRENYMLGMSSHAIKGNTTAPFVGLEKNTPLREYFYPLIVHTNYIGDKHRSLKERGLWLYEKHGVGTGNDSKALVCKGYTIHDSLYARLNWQQELAFATGSLGEALKSIPDRSAVRFPRDVSLWVLENGTLRHIPNMTVFENLGYHLFKVKSLSDSIHHLTPVGEPMRGDENPLDYGKRNVTEV